MIDKILIIANCPNKISNYKIFVNEISQICKKNDFSEIEIDNALRNFKEVCSTLYSPLRHIRISNGPLNLTKGSWGYFSNSITRDENLDVTTVYGVKKFYEKYIDSSYNIIIWDYQKNELIEKTVNTFNSNNLFSYDEI